jgi:hypothetical protein
MIRKLTSVLLALPGAVALCLAAWLGALTLLVAIVGVVLLLPYLWRRWLEANPLNSPLRRSELRQQSVTRPGSSSTLQTGRQAANEQGTGRERAGLESAASSPAAPAGREGEIPPRASRPGLGHDVLQFFREDAARGDQ